MCYRGWGRAASHMRKPRVPSHLPQKPVRVREVPRVPAPVRLVPRLDDPPAPGRGLGEERVDLFDGADVVGEREAGEAAPLGGHTGIRGQILPGEEREPG